MAHRYSGVLKDLKDAKAATTAHGNTDTVPISLPPVPGKSKLVPGMYSLGGLDVQADIRDVVAHSTGSLPQVLYAVSNNARGLPREAELKKAIAAESEAVASGAGAGAGAGAGTRVDAAQLQKLRNEHLAAVEKGYANFRATMESIHSASLPDVMEDWVAVRSKFSGQSMTLATALEEVVFPYNVFTRRRAALAGSQLYLPGLIKAVVTNFA